MIIEKLLPHVDRCAKVNVIIPKIEQTDPLFKGKGGVLVIMKQPKLGFSQKPRALQISLMGGLRGGKAPQADVLALVGQGRAKIRTSVLFICGIDALQMDILSCIVVG